MTTFAKMGPTLVLACVFALALVHCNAPERDFGGSGGTSGVTSGGGLGGGTSGGGGAQVTGGTSGGGGAQVTGGTSGGGGAQVTGGTSGDGGSGGSIDVPECEDDTNHDSDPENCGTCGRSCGDAACSAGVCEAEQYYSAGTISGIAAGGSRVLVHDGATILEVIGPGSAETITAGSSIGSMATDGDFVYWSQAGELWRTELATGNELRLAPSGTLPLVHGGFLFYQSGDRLIRRLNGRTNTGSQNIVELHISQSLATSIPFSTDGDITAYGIEDLGLYASQGDLSDNLLEQSSPAPRGVTAYSDRVYYLDGSGVSSVSLTDKTPVVIGDFTYTDGRLQIADEVAFAMVWSFGAQGSCPRTRLLQVPLTGGEPLERWTMTYTCGVALAVDGEHVYFVARPGPSATSASPLVQPTLFRLTK